MLLKKHGGIKEDAYMDNINLAYLLEDGMKIYIPTKQEIEAEKKDMNNDDEIFNMDLTQNYVNNSSGIKLEKEEDKNKEVNKININTATQTQLESLPGIGPSIATKIINYRKENGKFNKIEDIKEVSGIGNSKFEKIKAYITIK